MRRRGPKAARHLSPPSDRLRPALTCNSGDHHLLPGQEAVICNESNSTTFMGYDGQ
jgi:hypothetical protein